ncbi:MAG TPA: hypothetical protein VFU31_16950, partial [Candidatus Binatia bacterium]|nr:hypothetical protein [Candidatus Binatia bacterium]
MANRLKEIVRDSGTASLLVVWLVVGLEVLNGNFADAQPLQTVNMAIPAKSFQMVIYPLAKERGFMKEESIDLRVIYIAPVTSIQAML